MQSRLYCLSDPISGHMVVRVSSQREFKFVPYKVCAWDLFKDACGGLEDNGIGKGDNATAGLRLARAAEFHEVKAD